MTTAATSRIPAHNGTHRPTRYVPDRANLIDYTVPDFGDLWTPDLTVLPNGWAVAIATITPALAEAMLALNEDNQRNLVRSNIDRFAKDMAGGSWCLTHQGVAFNRAGRLGDG